MSKDTIYRQAAIDVARKCPVKEVTPAYMLIDKAEVMTELMMLPSAQPERIRGRWITMSDADGAYYCCSECGEELYRLWIFDREFNLFPHKESIPIPHKESIPKTNYCPNCGADMREK